VYWQDRGRREIVPVITEQFTFQFWERSLLCAAVWCLVTTELAVGVECILPHFRIREVLRSKLDPETDHHDYTSL
jgi:hypothetical protein